MKKHKSVVAILLSIMMIFAMMPAMAFAADAVQASWNGDYSKMTYGNYTYNTVRTFNTETGAVDVTVTPEANKDVEGLPAEGFNQTTSYFDLTNSALSVADGNLVKGTYNNASAYTKGMAMGLTFSVPSYASNQDKTATKYVAFTTLNATNWQGKVVGDENYENNSTADQTFTLSVEVSYDQAKDQGDGNYKFVGTVPQKAVTVVGRDGLPSDAKFFYDSADGVALEKGVEYDGAEHTVVMNEVKGLTPKYSVYDSTKGTWGEVAAVTVKDVTKGTPFRVQMYNAKNEKVGSEMSFTAKVNPAEAEFAFEETGNGVAYYTVEGADYDAVSYVTIINPQVVNKYDPATRAKYNANKKAIAANEAALKEVFGAFYDVDVTANKFNPDSLTLEISPKALTDKEETELEKKYATVLANFNIGIGDPDVAYLTTNFKGYDYEIEFVKSPTKKTYKAKVLKKKAKSFTVKAVANNETPVTYKLINAPEKITINKTTGKITLKKGLKKGTYKVKVKAYIPYVNEEGLHVTVSETHAITIKVTK